MARRRRAAASPRPVRACSAGNKAALDGAVEGALRRGHHDRAVHGLRRLRGHLPPRRHRLRARGGQVHAVPPRGGARPDNCIHGEKGCTTCTRACPRFRAWEPAADMHLFGRVREPDEMAGHLAPAAADPGQPTTSQHQTGQDGGFVSAMLIWLMEHDYIDAAMVSRRRGRRRLEGQAGARPQPRRGAGHRRAAATRTAPTRWPCARPRRRASTAWPSSGWAARQSSPPIMWDRKAGKVVQAVPVQHRPAVLEDVRRRHLPRAVRGQVRPEEAGHGEDEHQGRLPDLDEGRLVPRDRPQGVPRSGPARAASTAPTSPPSTPTSPPAASARTTTGRSPSCAPSSARRSSTG